jgi:dipeptidase E
VDSQQAFTGALTAAWEAEHVYEIAIEQARRERLLWRRRRVQGERRQIIALGGGGFGVDLTNLALDRYILAQARVPNPAVAFVPTASGDLDNYVVRFYTAYGGLPCRPSHLPFFRRTPDLRAYLLAQDVIYVGGGNTKSMLAVWREWSLPEILREAWESGIVLAGISAGAICWFAQGVTDSFADRLRALDCLGFLPGSCCPHYDGEPERRPAYHQLVLNGEMLPGFAIDNGAAIHFLDNDVHRAVASRQGAAVYHVGVVNGEVREEAMSVDYPLPC